MDFFKKYLNPTMVTPEMYGWFHWLFIGILTVAIIIFILKFKNTSDKTNRRIFLIFTVLFYFFEIYKQINFTFVSGSYQWYIFPFQFCSLPLYLFPVLIFLKEGKFKNVLYDFIGTFIFAAGISVLVYPESVFVNSIGINIQTMVHHSMMILSGIYVIISGRAKLSYKGFIPVIFVFIGFVFLADTLNLLFHNFIIPNDTFNMFIISPYYPNNMPLLMPLKENAPYSLFLLAYIFSFSMLSFIALNIGCGLQRLAKKQVVRVFYRNLKLLFNQL